MKTFGTDGGPAAQYAGPKIDAAKAALAGFGLPLNTLPVENKHLIAVAIALEGLGAALFVLGSELGAQMLVRAHRQTPQGLTADSCLTPTRAVQLLFLLVVTPIMHNFWSLNGDSAAALIEQVSFHKNIALGGALLFFLAMRRDAARLSLNEKLKAA